MIRRLAAWLAPEQPAEPSWLDRCDGIGRPMGANCCGAEVVTTVHGWTLCEEHASRGSERPSASDGREHNIAA